MQIASTAKIIFLIVFGFFSVLLSQLPHVPVHSFQHQQFFLLRFLAKYRFYPMVFALQLPLMVFLLHNWSRIFHYPLSRFHIFYSTFSFTSYSTIVSNDINPNLGIIICAFSELFPAYPVKSNRNSGEIISYPFSPCIKASVPLAMVLFSW